MVILDIIGWIGATAAVGAYYLLNRGKLSLRGFNWSEFLSAIPLSASAIAHHAYPSLAVTVSYGSVGLYGLLKNRTS